MARRSQTETSKAESDETPEPHAVTDEVKRFGALVPGARLEPIRYVERELTRPDGSKLRAKVPVYPPFRLEERPSAKATPDSHQHAPARRKAG